MPARQRIAGVPKGVETRAAGHEQRRLVAELIHHAFEKILPFGSLVQLVQYDERGILGPGQLSNNPAILHDIPVEVLPTLVKQRLGERRLAALAWASKQNHLFSQVPLYERGEVAHLAILKPTLFWSRPF